LISQKAAKEMFGKAWKFQAESLEKLGRKLGKALPVDAYFQGL
jgi:hypothetical protein